MHYAVCYSPSCIQNSSDPCESQDQVVGQSGTAELLPDSDAMGTRCYC